MNLEELLKCNASFDHRHGLGNYELRLALMHITNINASQSRNSRPSVGDLVEGTYYSNTEYSFGIVVGVSKEGGVVEVCYHPYIPFIDSNTDGIRLSVSGGPFTHVHESCFELVKEKEPRLFCDWGECGACGGGAFNFPANVKRWKLVEAPQVSRDVWENNHITYDITESQFYKAIRIPYMAMPGDMIEIQQKNDVWIKSEYLGYTAATIQKLEHEKVQSENR